MLANDGYEWQFDKRRSARPAEHIVRRRLRPVEISCRTSGMACGARPASGRSVRPWLWPSATGV